MGDPMHAQPAILNYKSGDTEYTTIFMATNEGFLHAIEHEEGSELYAFMPKELLPNTNAFYQNQQSTSHPYGLDGDLTIWHEDDNENVRVDGNERAFLFMGMRRGGNHYYAIDVSDRLNPKLVWQIDGGSGDFELLGQSWSKPVPTTMMINNERKKVLIFAGGYDENQDPTSENVVNRIDPSTGDVVSTQTGDTIGNAIYIVEAETGERLWVGQGSTGGDAYFEDMKFSIPGDINIVDVNSDGLADQMYFGDMGGQLWRFDVQPYHQSTDTQLIHGGVMADLSGTDVTHARRFYAEPDVALIVREGKRFLSVSIGSGWRAHPLNTTVEDRFYMIRTDNVYSRPEGYGRNIGTESNPIWTPITEADLVNVTNDVEAQLNDYGWMLDLETEGEKVMGQSITVSNKLIFTTYEPSADGDLCSPAIGGGSYYVVDVLNGAPVIDLDDSTSAGTGIPQEDSTGHRVASYTKSDRKKELDQDGIPSSPTVLINEIDGTNYVSGFVSTQIINGLTVQPLKRTYWQDHGRGSRHPSEVAESSDAAEE